MDCSTPIPKQDIQMNRPKIPINLEKELEGLLGKCKVGDVLIESGVKSYAQTVRKLSYQYDTLDRKSVV